MIQTLVKILEGEVDVDQLSESNIAEYLQARGTVQSLKKLIIDPFKAYATEKEPGELYEGEGVIVSVNESSKPKQFSDKEMIGMLESTLATFKELNRNGRNMHGLKRFEDTLAVDASYLNDLFSSWGKISMGKTVSKSVTYKGKAAKQIAEEHKGRLITAIAEDYSLEDREEVTASDVALYLAADKQVKALNKRVVGPFEKAFKENAVTNDEKTEFDNHRYDGLIVQVKSVPREEPNYSIVRANIAGNLDEYASLREEDCDNVETFFNTDLKEPRAYVAVGTLLDQIASEIDQTDLKMKQEVSVLYAPEEATILTK